MTESFPILSFSDLSEDDMCVLAQKVSTVVKRGDVFALYGTLGAGKSVFARAFIQSLTTAQDVPSPTFTLVQTYQAQHFEIYHFDLYRLKSEDEIWELNIEEALYGGVCLIEWPEKAGLYLPRNVFKVNISVQENNKRAVKISITDTDKANRLQTIDFKDLNTNG